MNAGFVDPGGWMACADRSDPAHVACTAARDATLEAGRLLITTDFVVDETLTLIRFRLGLAAANAWWEQIDGSARLRWERVENDRFERARHLFFQYRDRDLSFTDCTSFAVMRELRLTTVITTMGTFARSGSMCYPRLGLEERASHGALDDPSDPRRIMNLCALSSARAPSTR
jgi:predicted nucleic acid-binding protein